MMRDYIIAFIGLLVMGFMLTVTVTAIGLKEVIDRQTIEQKKIMQLNETRIKDLYRQIEEHERAIKDLEMAETLRKKKLRDKLIFSMEEHKE